MESQAEIEQILYNEFCRLNVPHKSNQQIIHAEVQYFELSPGWECDWGVKGDHVWVRLWAPDLFSGMRYVIAEWIHSNLIKDPSDQFTRFKRLYYLCVVCLTILSLVNQFGFFPIYPLSSILFTVIFLSLLIFSQIVYLKWRNRMKLRFTKVLHESPLKFTVEEMNHHQKYFFRSQYLMPSVYFAIYSFLAFVIIVAFLNYFEIL